AAWGEALQSALPEGSVKVTLGRTSIHGPVLDIEVEGGMTLSKPQPTGSFNVTVNGLDDAIALLQDAGEDPMAAQALASLTLFQSWGRQASDGTITYGIEMKGDGEISVNGQIVKPAADKAL